MANNLTSAANTATPTQGEPSAQSIPSMRKRIDEIDAAIIRLWQERAGISREIGMIRVAAGGTRLVLSREREVMERFRSAIGDDGVQLALLVLRAGRGPLAPAGSAKPQAAG